MVRDGGHGVAGACPDLVAVVGAYPGQAKEVGVALVVLGIEEVAAGDGARGSVEPGFAVGLEAWEDQRGSGGGAGELQAEPAGELVRE